MAPAVTARLHTVGTWSARSTTIGAVLAALAELRRHDARCAVRTSVLTLVVVGDGGLDVDDALAVVHELGDHHPSRVIVVRRRSEGQAHRLDARVGVHLVSRGALCLGLDDVALDVAGPVTAHLDSLIEPLTLADLPVVAWPCAAVPAPDDALTAAADHMIVDLAEVGGRAALGDLAALAVPVTDLAWSRLTPLRRQLADLLRQPGLVGVLDRLNGAAVGGDDLERALLGGWLADRLPGVPVGRLGAAAPVIELESPVAYVTVRAGRDEIVAAVRPPDGEPWGTTGPPRATSRTTLVAQALVHLQPDPVFTAALAAASGV